MKRTFKTIAVSLIVAMIMSLAACSQPVNTNTESSVVSENTSFVSEVTAPESSASETPSATSDTSKAESITESSVSSNTESSEQSKAEQSQQSKPTTSKPVTTSEPNKTQNSTPTSTTSKPAETSQVSKPTTNNTQTSKPTSSNTSSNQTSSKPTETSQASKPSTSTSQPTTTTKPVTKPSVQSISFNKTSLTLTVGQTAKLSYSVSPSNASYKTEWTTSNNSVASIAGDGTVTAKAAGKANITIKTSNGKSATCTVTVKAKTMTKEEKIAAAYQAPYEGKITGWQETVIADLREVGEKKYNMVWEDSFYVRKRGTEYNCGFNFPISNFDCWDGKGFRSDCLYLFEELESQLARNNEDIADGYTRFKIIIEDLGVDKYRDEHEFFVYLCYG